MSQDLNDYCDFLEYLHGCYDNCFRFLNCKKFIDMMERYFQFNKVHKFTLMEAKNRAQFFRLYHSNNILETYKHWFDFFQNEQKYIPRYAIIIILNKITVFPNMEFIDFYNRWHTINSNPSIFNQLLLFEYYYTANLVSSINNILNEKYKHWITKHCKD